MDRVLPGPVGSPTSAFLVARADFVCLSRLTTATTGRPWGILDDEITIEYADSTRLVGDSLLDFFDSDESNAHLELMRLRGQAYSSLYGYAGTAINPYSHISLFNFDLGNSLSQQHLDKMDEFHQGLIAWQKDLSPKLKLIRSWDASLMNLNRVNASLYLIYHQVGSLCSASPLVSLLMCTRLFWCFSDRRWSIFTMTGSKHEAKVLQA